MDNALGDYPVVIDIPVAWGDMDAFGHVNNTVYFRYFESARLAYFEALGVVALMRELGVGPILASVQCRFKVPLTYPDTVFVGAQVTALGQDRFTMRHAVWSRQHRNIVAEGEGVVVTFNYRDNGKTAIPEAIIQRIREIEGH